MGILRTQKQILLRRTQGAVIRGTGEFSVIRGERERKDKVREA